MDEFLPFPYYQYEKNLLDGYYIKTEEFCKKHNSKCNKYYIEISNTPGFHICPYGFTTYVKDGSIIFSGIRVLNKYNKKKIKYKVQSKSFNPILSEEQFFSFLNLHNEILNRIKQFDKKLNDLKVINYELEKIVQENSNFNNLTIHEIRKLNTAIKTNSEKTLKEIDNKKFNIKYIKNKINNIFATSSLISIRLNSYDILVNPSIIQKEAKKKMEIYKKFEKVSHCLETSFKNKNIEHIIKEKSYKIIYGYEIFEILPYLLFDNALKYSPENQKITTTFNEEKEKTLIEITSIGPILENGENNKIFEKNFRGENAKLLNVSGTGTGLFLAKEICDLHNIKINVKSFSNKIDINNVIFSKFTIILEI